jgi:hypothetical protein
MPPVLPKRTFESLPYGWVEKVTFVSGKPVCPSGLVEPTQSTTRVQNPDGTWKTVAAGAWGCWKLVPYPRR